MGPGASRLHRPCAVAGHFLSVLSTVRRATRRPRRGGRSVEAAHTDPARLLAGLQIYRGIQQGGLRGARSPDVDASGRAGWYERVELAGPPVSAEKLHEVGRLH